MGDSEPVDLAIPGLGPAVRIGSGGFADVYRATQTNLHRQVAVKVLRAADDDDQARMRFERECQAMGSLSAHPNIASVHEGGFTSDGRAYLVMELFTGGSLQERLAARGPLPAPEVIEIGVKIGRALGVAHDAGVLHRDVKPANILVSVYGEPALADFGIARVEGAQHTATGLVTASLAHAAPEVLEGGQPSPVSDLYSLASTLFELATGRAPHVRPGDESVWAIMNRVLNEPIPDPRRAGVPEPLASVLIRATSRQPGGRYAIARELVEALSAAPAAATELAGPTSSAPATRPSAQVPSHPGWATPESMVTSTTSPAGQATRYQPAATPVTQAPGATSGAASGAPAVGATGPAAAPRRRGPGRVARSVAALVVLLAALAGGAWWYTTSTSSLAPVALSFEEGAAGPLDAGVAYSPTLDGAGDGALVRYVVDGAPLGEPQAELPPYEPEAGRHSLAVEVTRDGVVEVTEAVELYVIGEIPEAGFRVNLASVADDPERWPATLRLFDRLVAQGHTELQLLPSNRFPVLIPDKWNLFVSGFGDDPAAARAYCEDHGLAVPHECFARRFDPKAS